MLTPERTLAGLAFRQLVARRRVLLVAAFAALPAALALLFPPDDPSIAPLLGLYLELIVPVLLPITALVVGTGVFGSEIDDGTITYVLGKPVPRWRIVVTRIVVAGAATALVVVPATVAAGLVLMRGAEDSGVIAAFAAGTALGGLLYAALFVALSLSTRRALVAGLVYVVVWEGMLADAFAGTRLLSVRQYTLAVADALSGTAPEVFRAALGAELALGLAAGVAAAATALAVWRLQRFEIGEAA